MEQENIYRFADALQTARLQKKPIAYLSASQKFTINDAYKIQQRQLEERQKKGETQSGWKMGLTSKAKREQMNLFSSVYGFLTKEMAITDTKALSLTNYIHPKAEPEVAFLIGKNLPKNPTVIDIENSISHVCAAIEILDTRYEAFKYFSLEDVVADNSSSAAYCLGPWHSFSDVRNNLSQAKMKFFVNDVLAHQASAMEISGNPVQSVVELCELLKQSDKTLNAGTVVLAGAATPAVNLEPGQKISLDVDGLTSIAFFVK